MKRMIIGGLIVTLVLILGCSSVSPLPTQTPSGVANIPVNDKPPPDTANWISPAKVNISNFHLDATAEYPLTVHNGNKEKVKFEVKPRVADYVSAGYMKMPVDVMQDWVIVADSSPVLASLETRDILVTLTMPAKVDDQVAQFWQFTDDGVAYLVALQTAAMKTVKDAATKQIQEKYKNRPQDITAEMIEELITPKAIEAELMKNPDASLLVYMVRNSSVSFRKFQADQGQNIALATSFEQRNYVQKGDLRKGKWEFWVSVMESPKAGVTGTKIVTEVASRWLVVMRM